MLTVAVIIIVVLLFAVFSIHSDVEKAIARVDKLETLLQDAHEKIEEVDNNITELLGECDCNNDAENFSYEFLYKLKEIQCDLRNNKNKINWDYHWREEWENVPDRYYGRYHLKKNYDG